MKSRLDRIDALISEGYTLNKIWGFYPDLKTSAGKSVDIFGSLFRLAGPAGFSWVAFFFPWAVCVQIREWSFFYSLFIFFALRYNLSHLLLGINQHRKLAKFTNLLLVRMHVSLSQIFGCQEECG